MPEGRGFTPRFGKCREHIIKSPAWDTSKRGVQGLPNRELQLGAESFTRIIGLGAASWT